MSRVSRRNKHSAKSIAESVGLFNHREPGDHREFVQTIIFSLCSLWSPWFKNENGYYLPLAK